MKIYYLANARMPTEKAHGIQIAKMCEAFLAEGAEVTLVVPARWSQRSLKDFYGLQRDIPIVRIPVLPCYEWGPFWYRLATGFFIDATLLYLWWKRLCGECAVGYEIDMDQLSILAGPFMPWPFTIEIHDAKPRTALFNFIFRHAAGVVTINTIIKKKITERFTVPSERIVARPNGIDIPFIKSGGEQKQARARLALPADKKIALSTGQFYDWKGLEIVPETARAMPDILFVLVGGSREEFVRLTDLKDLPPNLHFVGKRPYPEIPRWLAAADVLFVIGTKQNEYSYYHTSPMKLFEYLPAGKPIVAARTPAIADSVSDKEVFFYEPDSASSFADTLRRALVLGSRAPQIVAAAALAEKYTWRERARAVLGLILKG